MEIKKGCVTGMESKNKVDGLLKNKKKIIIFGSAFAALLIFIAIASANPCIIGQHTYDEGVTITPSTCVIKGEAKYTCTECERKSYTEELPLSDTNHNWGKFKVIEEGSGCDVSGEKERVCKDCGDTDWESVDPPLEHSYTSWKFEGRNATEFLFERECTRCGDVDTKSEARHRVRCDNCNGSGSVRYYYGASDLEAYLDGYDPYTVGDCPLCDGTGMAYADYPNE